MMTVDTQSVVDKKDLIQRAKEALAAVKKNSKLRDHLIKLVVMNNIMRAFVTVYDMPADFKATQQVFQETLTRVQARKNRLWLTSDLIGAQEAVHAYELLIESSSEEQIAEMLEFVNFNRSEGRWGILTDK